MISDRFSVSMVSVASTVIWLTWAVAGLAGLGSYGDEPVHLHRAETTVSVERLDVEVTAAQRSPLIASVQEVSAPTPEVPRSIPLPALIPVGDSKLDVPFPVMVKGDSNVVEARRAAPMALRVGPAVEHLTLGEGEGDQPAPDYPREAKLAHEEGSVVVQMTIDESGDVTDAVITSASPWPILNQAAIRAVRDTWRFPRGSVRRKDIQFVFQLRQR